MTRYRHHFSPAAVIRIAFYALAGIIGVVLTYRFNTQWTQQQGGFDVADYVRAGFANPASTSFSIDLIVAALAGTLFMVVEGIRLRMRSTIPLIISIFVLAFAFAFPMFLALREVKLARVATPQPEE